MEQYLRGVLFCVGKCVYHNAVILTSVETGGIMAVTSRGDTLHFVENNRLYDGLLLKAIASQTGL